jgi:hypothetical protein
VTASSVTLAWEVVALCAAAELRKRADPKKATNSLQDEDMMIPSV